MDDENDTTPPEEQPGSERPAAHIRDRSSHATGSSIFDKADAGNRKLSRR